MTDTLLIDRSEGVSTLTINRPEVRNAVDDRTMRRLGEALAACVDDGTRVIVITGVDGAFSSGADIKAALASDITPDAAYHILSRSYAPALKAVRECPWPVIAAVDGVAAGIGLDLALVCDIRLASERASFAELFVRVGLVPDGGGTYTLQRLIGAGRAMEMILTGEAVDARRAYDIGLANRVFPVGGFRAAVAHFAGTLAVQSPQALRRGKQAMLAAQEGTFDDALAREAVHQLAIFESEDGFEGFRAFLEKRPPKWTGR